MREIDSREAEVAAENYLKSLPGVVETRRALRSRFNVVDFFGSDVMAKATTFTAYVQVTTAQRDDNVRKRRRRLDKVPWLPTDVVQVFELEVRSGIVRKNRHEYYFRVHELISKNGGPREWVVLDEPIEVQREWLRVNKKPKTQ